MKRVSACALFLGVWLVPAGLSGDVSPAIAVRFDGSQTDDGPVWAQTARVLEKAQDGCGEVLFSTCPGIPPISAHTVHSRRLAAAAEDVRSQGRSASLYLRATLGAEDERAAREGDWSGKTWGGFTTAQGIVCRSVSCPRRQEYHAYLTQMARLYAAWRPHAVWIGKDLRIDHAPAAQQDAPTAHGGCFCETCLGAFSAMVREPYTRVSLVAALAGDPMLKYRWEHFSYASLALVAHTLAGAVKSVSPQTRMGYMPAYGDEKHQQLVMDALADASGAPVRAVLGGDGAFAHAPDAWLSHVMRLSRQAKALAAYEGLDRLYVSLTSGPRMFHARSARRLAAESCVALSQGVQGLCYALNDLAYEAPDRLETVFFAHARGFAPQARAYAERCRGTYCAGLEVLSDAPADALSVSGLPLTAGASAHAPAVLMTAADASRMTVEHAQACFRRGVVLDGAAAQVLVRRGCGALFGGLKVRSAPAGVRERFTDDVLLAGLLSRSAGVRQKSFMMQSTNATLRVLGRYVDHDGKEQGAATVCGLSPLGGRFAVFGAGGFVPQDAAGDHMRRFYRIADYVCRHRLAFVPEDPVRAFVVPRVREDGSADSVFVLNPSCEDIGAFRVRLRTVRQDVRAAKWKDVAGGEQEVLLRREGAETFAVIPALASWQCGWLAF